MTSIGDTLRRERLKQKLDLQAVSGELKISPRLLEAIEDEKFDKLPGGVFTRSFVRQYARLLGLDEDEIGSELQRALEPEVPAAQAHPTSISLPRLEEWETAAEPRFHWSKSLPALAMVVVVVLLCSAIYTWVQRTRRAAPATQGSKPAPVETVRTPSPPAAPAEQAKAPERAPAVADQKQETTPETQVATTVAQPQSPAASTALTAPPAAGAASPAPIHVEMTAQEPVWVSAHADGKYLFSGTLQPNETRTAEGTGTVVLRLGNAGGINISLNGKPIGPVGPKGQIRTVQLTSGGFQVLPPEPPNPTPPIDSSDPL